MKVNMKVTLKCFVVYCSLPLAYSRLICFWKNKKRREIISFGMNILTQTLLWTLQISWICTVKRSSQTLWISTLRLHKSWITLKHQGVRSPVSRVINPPTNYNVVAAEVRACLAWVTWEVFFFFFLACLFISLHSVVKLERRKTGVNCSWQGRQKRTRWGPHI